MGKVMFETKLNNFLKKELGDDYFSYIEKLERKASALTIALLCAYSEVRTCSRLLDSGSKTVGTAYDTDMEALRVVLEEFKVEINDIKNNKGRWEDVRHRL